MKNKMDYSLYLCTDSNLTKYSNEYKCIEEAIMGGVTFVQVRAKEKTTKDFIKYAKKIKKITSKYSIPLVINDRVDVALAINADGVHLGNDDMTCKTARKILGKNSIIGISVINLKQAKQAKKDGADYIGVGAMFATTTKKDAKLVKLEELRKIIENVDIPIVLIGGINEKTIKYFNNWNIAGYAMVSPIVSSENVLEKTKKIKDIVLTTMRS